MKKQSIQEIIKEGLESFKSASLSKTMSRDEITGYFSAMIYANDKRIDNAGLIAKDVLEIVRRINQWKILKELVIKHYRTI